MPAGSSKNHTNLPFLLGLTFALGMVKSASFRILFSISALPSPTAQKNKKFELLINGNVSVTRSGGGFGLSEIGSTSWVWVLASKKSLWSGNKLHVCPSGPLIY